MQKEEKKEVKDTGMAGMVAGTSAICTVGTGCGLNYRGYNIIGMAKNCIFEEIAYLLLVGHFPNEKNLATFRQEISSRRTIPDKLKTVLEMMPKETHPMDVLKVATAFLGVLEPEGSTQE